MTHKGNPLMSAGYHGAHRNKDFLVGISNSNIRGMSRVIHSMIIPKEVNYTKNAS